MVRAAAFLSLVLVAAGAAAAGISGLPSVTDGDTLRIGPERIRLHGIDAPESAQSCQRGRQDLGLRRSRHPSASRAHRPTGRSSAPSTTATATGVSSRCAGSAGADVNAWMVDSGVGGGLPEVFDGLRLAGGGGEGRPSGPVAR